MRLLLSRFLLALAAAAAALPALIALPLAHPPLGLQRFREPSLAVYALLALAVLAGPQPRERFTRWTVRARAMLDAPRFFPVAASVMAALYVLSVVGRHLAFRTSSHDFAMLDEAISLLPGKSLLYTPILQRSFLSEHFSPILLALVPIRALLPSPYVLIVAQAGALWGAGVVLRRVLLEDGHARWLANLAFVVWLNHPFVVTALQYVAHMETFLPVLLFGAVLAERRGRPWLAAALLLGTLLVKEDVGLYLAGYGVWMAVARRRGAGGAPTTEREFRRRAAGATLAAAGVTWTFLCLDVAIPHFAPPGEGFRFLDRWSHWGAGPFGVLAGWITHPIAVLDLLLGRAPARLFGALLFLPFFTRWGTLIFLAPWIMNTTSGNAQQSGLSLYYGIPLVAFATVAAIEGLRTNAFRRIARSRWAGAVAVAAVVLNVAHFRYPPLATDRAEFLRALEDVPPGATVQTMPCFYPVLGPDRDRRLIDSPVALTAPWVAIRTHSTTWPLSGSEAEEAVRSAIAGGYEVVADLDGAFLLRAPAR